MELDNFSWGLIDDSNLDISNTNVNTNQHNMDLNDDSDNIGGYNPDKMNLSFDEFSFDISKKHDTIGHGIGSNGIHTNEHDNVNNISDPTLSLPNSFNMSPVTLKTDKADNKTNLLYTPIIKHLHSQLKSLVISESYYTELKLKAANALTSKAAKNGNGKVVELSLYEEACLRYVYVCICIYEYR